MQNLLIMKLREIEETGGGTQAAIGSIEVAAMSQHDLITWYFDYQTSRYVSQDMFQDTSSFSRGRQVFRAVHVAVPLGTSMARYMSSP